MIVDDFSTMRRIMRNILRGLEFRNILEAEDGAAAVRILETQPVDLVISDWNMPKMTGLDLLRHLRGDEKTKDLPFLMVTAETQKESVVEAVKARVSNYILKPFTAATLAEKLSKILPPA